MQAKDKVSRLPLRWRLRVAEMLIEGASYQEVRAKLRTLGATDEQLPSDHSLNVFKGTDEFEKLVEQEIQRYYLERRATAAGSMMESMATLTLGNAMRLLDRALQNETMSTKDTLETLRAMTQHHALQLAAVRERRLWGDTEGEPPALLRRLAGGEIGQMGVAVTYDELHAPVHPETPLAESLLDLDAMCDEAARAAVGKGTVEGGKAVARAAAGAMEQVIAPVVEAKAEPVFVAAQAPAGAKAAAKSPEMVAMERDVQALTAMTEALERASKAHRQLEAQGMPAVVPPQRAVACASVTASPVAVGPGNPQAGASNPKETEVTGSKAKESEAGRGSVPVAAPSQAPQRAGVSEYPTGQPKPNRSGGGGSDGNRVPMGGFFGRGRLAEEDRAGMVGGCYHPFSNVVSNLRMLL